MGEIISFLNQKGGVGKTTSCVNMSACLANQGKKILIIDMDPQGNATTGLGLNKKQQKQSVYNIMIEGVDPIDVIVKSKFKNLDIIPSSIDLAGGEVDLVYKENRERRLKNSIQKVKDSYDYIMIDCPPALGLISINALTASDSIIIPIQCEFYALEGLSQLMNTIKLTTRHLNTNLKIKGVLLTMFDRRALVSRQISEEIRAFFGKLVFDTEIPRNIRLSEAPSHGLPITEYEPNCSGARAYTQVTKEFLNKEKGE